MSFDEYKDITLDGIKRFHDIIKSDQTLSRLIPQLGLPYGDKIGSVVGALGYGRGPQMHTMGPQMHPIHGMGVASSGGPSYTVSGRSPQISQAIATLPTLGPPGHEGISGLRLRNALVAAGFGRRVSRIKSGKGILEFARQLLQAPLAGLAATSGGLHGALGSFGKPKRKRAKKSKK